MKKVIVILLILTALLISCENGSEKTEYTYNDFICTDCDDGVSVAGYIGLDVNVVFPDEINGKPVTEISRNAFFERIGIESVQIPDSVVRISGAFCGCPDLRTVKIGKGVVEMERAFCDCKSLESYEGCENAVIMTGAFESCVNLRKGFIPSSAEDCDGTFMGCFSLEDVKIEAGIIALDGTFEDCTSLKSVAVPDTVTELDGTFRGCRVLENIEGLDNVAKLFSTFCDCSSLKTVKLGRFVTDMSGVFTGCASLTEIENMPREVETWEACFGGCSSMEFLRIPVIRGEKSRLEYDAEGEFDGCISLKTVIVDCDIINAESFRHIFNDCENLEVVTLTPDSVHALIEIGYVYTDEIYNGDNRQILNRAILYSAESGVRAVSGYATLDGKDYSHISGADINPVDLQAEAEGKDANGFIPYEKVSYWIGYETEGERAATTVAVKRTYLICDTMTGAGGNCPDEIYVNGVKCHVGMQ